MGVLLAKCRIPVMDLPVIRSWYRFASTKFVIVTNLQWGGYIMGQDFF